MYEYKCILIFCLPGMLNGYKYDKLINIFNKRKKLIDKKSKLVYIQTNLIITKYYNYYNKFLKNDQ